MKTDTRYTNQEIDLWCNIFDQEIVIDIWESYMNPEPDKKDFREFLEKYQAAHLKKYGNFLELKS
jgi:hypothetical protein